MRTISSVAVAIVCGVTAILSSGCASSRIQAQWKDPQFAGQSLRGEKVLIVCDAKELAVKRICQDRMAAQLGAAGAIPVSPADPGQVAGSSAGSPGDAVLAEARNAGAKAVWVSAIAPEATFVDPGPTLGVGVGTGGWNSGTFGGVGVGVTAPVGSPQTHVAYAANLTLTDVSTGRLIWTSKVTTPASRDVGEQISKLAQTGVDAAQKAGVL